MEWIVLHTYNLENIIFQVKKAIEKQREQQQQACVQNNNSDSIQSNRISPGDLFIATVYHLSQIYLFNLHQLYWE